MAIDPRDEPCAVCGCEVDECICGMVPDFPDDVIDELDTDYLSWAFYEETDVPFEVPYLEAREAVENEADANEDSIGAGDVREDDPRGDSPPGPVGDPPTEGDYRVDRQ